MKKQITAITTLIILSHLLIFAQESRVDPENSFKREKIEWCDVWIPSANRSDKPRVLLVGDSISKNYYNSVAGHLSGQFHCARFATSASVADPVFPGQLETLLTGYSYEVIHLNNGLHGFDYTEEEYRAGYERTLELLKVKTAGTSLILALTTPVLSTSDRGHLNSRIDARNGIVRKLAKKYAAAVNDLHGPMKGNPGYYRDPYHFKKDAVEIQAARVAAKIREIMKHE